MIDRRLIKHTIYNLAGLGLPLIVAIVAIPLLIGYLGETSFGILTLIWAVVSYFGLLDLGLGRALTQSLSVAIARNEVDNLKTIVGTGLRLMLVLGIGVGLLLAVCAPALAAMMAPAEAVPDVVRALYWMAFGVPAIVVTSGYRGMLEARSEFAVVNLIRVPMGVFTFGGPLLVAWQGSTSLSLISAVLCAGRIIGCVVHGYFALRCFDEVAGHGRFDRTQMWPLLSFGGWTSISGIVAPLMNYIDRFLCAFLISASAAAYYATPQELVLRLAIIPGALAAVLLPNFAARFADPNHSQAQAAREVWVYSGLLAIILLPFAGTLFIFAEPILTLWIDADFANQSHGVLRMLSLGVLLSGIANVPYAMLLSRGDAKRSALLHLAELVVYSALLVILIDRAGIMGAAVACLIRIAIDTAALFLLCLWRPRGATGARELGTAAK